MNFYGHACFAARRREAPGYVLGSMLPDFEGMSRSRIVACHDASIRDGIALHHATDEVFHGAPEFLALCAEGLEALSALGVSRAAARASAHVGTELVFDAYLLERHGPLPVYLDALDEAARSREALVFADEGGRFDVLRGRLRDFGFPFAYGDPVFVADRLEGALAGRPRLALREGDKPALVRWLEAAIPRIVAIAPALEARVTDTLPGP